MTRTALDRAVHAALSYDEVGATAADLPPGYRHVHRRSQVGSGPGAFERAAARLAGWDMHRGAGLRVAATAPRAGLDVTVVVSPGIGPLRLAAPCRVVAEVDEPWRRGFAYGTLHGHPESGEESFVVSLEDDGAVLLTILAFSRPQTRLARLGGPVNRLAQDRITGRYVRALASPA